MTRAVQSAFLLALTWAALSSRHMGRASADVVSGLVVVEVGAGESGASAGVEVGDVLLEWERPGSDAARGVLRTPFDFWILERAQAARGPVTIRGRRGSEAVSFTLQPREWKVEVRPALGAELAAAYDRARGLLVRGGPDLEDGARLSRETAAALAAADETASACWVLFKLGQALAAQRQWVQAQEAYDAALPHARTREEQVAVHQWRGRAFLGAFADEKAMEALRAGLAIQKEIEPDGLIVASLTHDMGTAAWSHDLDEAERFYREAAARIEALAPDSYVLAPSLNNLAVVLAEKGDHRAAESYYEKALPIFERTSPPERIADCLNNIAIEARIRGDLARAEELLLRARDLLKRHEPESLKLANVLHSLANVSYVRRDFDRAQQLFEQALALVERVASGTPRMVRALNALGAIANDRGDLAACEGYYRRALAVAETQQAPRETAEVHGNLARVLQARGQLERAEESVREAIRTLDPIAPRGVPMAIMHERLGLILADRKRPEAAGQALRHALEIHRQLGPGSAEEARALALVARWARSTGDDAQAAELYGRAIDVLDGQAPKLGGSFEARLAFASSFDNIYRETVALLAERGQAAEALRVLERSRARSFRAMLSEREIVDAEIPAELQARRRRMDADYDRTQARLARLDPLADRESAATLTQALREIRAEQAEVQDEIRRASSRAAALRDPQPLDLAGIQAALDPGTALLSYAVGEDRTFLFVVTRERGLELFAVPAGRRELASKVRAFRSLIERARVDEAAEVDRTAAALFDLLVAPADSVAARAARLVVCPDGPLHTLPFAALRRRDRYLVEWKPLHSVLSATVYAELRAGRPAPRGGGPVVAFGDPAHSRAASRTGAAPIRDAELREVVRSGASLDPLPSTRREVEAIARLYDDTHVYVGDAATEERAKKETRSARYLHFACHGFIDERLPLNSGLVLATRQSSGEGQDNGLLQAWEVFERVRVDAELVTLSACNTALGSEMGGEGLIGLTRAFQYAGARSVVASLWAVPDRSTADLMRVFYGGLRRGLSKDEALRQAQIAVLRSSATRSRPFRWAGFQLFGDWH